jgi:hypothetical protein
MTGEISLGQAMKRIEELEARIRQIENNVDLKQVGFWKSVLQRLINQDMIRSLFHTEILREAGLIQKASILAIEAKAKELFVNEPDYSLTPRLADLNLQAVMSEMRGEYKSADDFNPMFANKKTDT